MGPVKSRHRFAAFWATALVVIGMLLVVGGVLFAIAAVALDMPWGRLTGQAVLERALAAAVLVISGILAGAPFIVLGEMMRLFIEQRQVIGRQRRLLARIVRRLDEAAGTAERRPASPSPADRLLQQRRP
jgi:hypothetical protein